MYHERFIFIRHTRAILFPNRVMGTHFLDTFSTMKKGLFALATGTLGFGLTEYVMMGILPNIANELGITIPEAGHFISAYALGVGIGAPIMVILARKRPLKQILLGLIAIFIAANLALSIAPNETVALIFRFISGLPHGAYFGVGAIVAERLVPPERKSSAVALMIAGMTVATLIGVPFGTLVTDMFSWRSAFLLVGLWGFMVFALIWVWIPKTDPLPDAGFAGEFAFLKTPAPLLIIAASILGNGGIFCWYSYITPLLTKVSGFPFDTVIFLMMLAGAGMFAGNLIGGRLSDRFTPGKVSTATQGIAAIALLLVFFFAHVQFISLCLMVLLTACLFAMSTPEQVLLIEHSEGGELLGAASAQVAFNLGNALGAFMGGLPIMAGLPYNSTALTGTFFAFAGFILLFIFVRKYGRPVASVPKQATPG